MLKVGSVNPNSLMLCPLCESPDIRFFAEDKNKRYRHCRLCDLVFAEPVFWPDSSEEQARYNAHENTIEDEGYVNFLSRIIEPMLSCINKDALGLDFGSGPNPVLAKLFKERGFKMQIYDPFFAPNQKVLKQQYDFITATEVVEHMHQPGKDFERLFSILKEDGVLAIMTKLRTNDIEFTTWHYKNDLTHVCFYSPETMQWIAKQFKRHVQIILPDLVYFT